VAEEGLTAEEMRELNQRGRAKEDAELERPVQPEHEAAVDPAVDELAAINDDPSAMPSWAQAAIPAGLQIPRGRTVIVFRFLREWTDDKVQDRTCVLWNLSVGDEKLANQRGGDNSNNVLMELSKQMIRAIDGAKIDYTGRDKSVDINAWWNVIGRKCRSLIVSAFVRNHSLTTAEKIDFLAHHQCARTFYAVG